MRIIILIIIIAFCIKGNAQYEGYIICNFEESSESYLTIDTVNGKNNIWQIGNPGKSYLSSAYSSPNVIITELDDFVEELKQKTSWDEDIDEIFDGYDWPYPYN